MISSHPRQQLGQERQSRIVVAALEVFSKSSFGDATTDEIARRAHVSKRDIYNTFSDKHAILIAAVDMVLQTGDENLEHVVFDVQQGGTSIKEMLEIVGLALVSEILSPSSGFVFRLVLSESVGQPAIGAAYFENWYNRRSRRVAQFLSRQLTKPNGKSGRSMDTNAASKHFVGLVTHLPQLTAGVGMLEMWNSKSVQSHVRSSVECFLKAYPDLG